MSEKRMNYLFEEGPRTANQPIDGSMLSAVIDQALKENSAMFGLPDSAGEALRDAQYAAVEVLSKYAEGADLTDAQYSGLSLLAGYGMFMDVIDHIRSSNHPALRWAYAETTLRVLLGNTLFATLAEWTDRGNIEKPVEALQSAAKAIHLVDEHRIPLDTLINAIKEHDANAKIETATNEAAEEMKALRKVVAAMEEALPSVKDAALRSKMEASIAKIRQVDTHAQSDDGVICGEATVEVAEGQSEVDAATDLIYGKLTAAGKSVNKEKLRAGVQRAYDNGGSVVLPMTDLED